MKKSILIKCLLVAVGLPLISGCVEREVVYRPAPGAVVTDEATPPPLQAEIIPVAPGPLDVWLWIPGCWEWQGHWRGHWAWHCGYWSARPHPNAVWVHPHWVWHRHHRVWLRGYWR